MDKVFLLKYGDDDSFNVVKAATYEEAKAVFWAFLLECSEGEEEDLSEDEVHGCEAVFKDGEAVSEPIEL